MYKNNVLFSKFILLISEGQDYDQLIRNRDEEILAQKCRKWNTSVHCAFDSTPLFKPLQQQLENIDRVMGDMDIRGKVADINARKKFHLIEHHSPPESPPPPLNSSIPPTTTNNNIINKKV